MNLTLEQLKRIIPTNQYVSEWFEALTKILPDYEINTKERIAAFLAQCSHESGGFKTLKENLNYKSDSLMRVFPHYFPNQELADKYAHNQEAIANRVYGNRMGNGSEESGDGFRYCGRGLIQLTGKDNYSNFAISLEMKVEDVPEYLATFEGAVQSACWFWETNNLNTLADKSDIVTLTKRINGGTIGLEERQNNFNNFIKILGE